MTLILMEKCVLLSIILLSFVVKGQYVHFENKLIPYIDGPDISIGKDMRNKVGQQIRYWKYPWI